MTLILHKTGNYYKNSFTKDYIDRIKSKNKIFILIEPDDIC